MKSRSESPGLGKALVQHAPFLRMYADYVKNFDQAMELVGTWTKCSPAFRTIIQDIQVVNPQISLVFTRSSERDVVFVVLESGGVWQPQPAAPHVGAGAEGPALRVAAEGLPEEASRGQPRLPARSK